MLQPVKDGVAQGFAAEQQLAAITMECDFTAADVEVVDVTNQLVEIFKPTDKTRDIAPRCKAQPESLLVLADLRAED